MAAVSLRPIIHGSTPPPLPSVPDTRLQFACNNEFGTPSNEGKECMTSDEFTCTVGDFLFESLKADIVLFSDNVPVWRRPPHHVTLHGPIYAFTNVIMRIHAWQPARTCLHAISR